MMFQQSLVCVFLLALLSASLIAGIKSTKFSSEDPSNRREKRAIEDEDTMQRRRFINRHQRNIFI